MVIQDRQIKLIPETDIISLPAGLTDENLGGCLMGKKFIDLFAGIGGIRIGFDKLGAECVFTSEKDKFAQQTYLANFGSDEVARTFLRASYKKNQDHIMAGDITAIEASQVPDHDILLAGFPCQAFSQAGHKLGLEDTRGTMFYEIQRILSEKKPEIFILENVKHLIKHDDGNTYKIMEEILLSLGYDVHRQIINALHFLPQNRERIVIVGNRRSENKIPFSFNYLNKPEINLHEHPEQRLRYILHDESPGGEIPELGYTIDSIDEFGNSFSKVNDKYTISSHLWNYLQERKALQRNKGNGFGFNLIDPDEEYGYTLSARYHKDGSENLIPTATGRPRKLTPRECARLMGFPDEFKIPVSDTQAYKQFGNSVAVPLFENIAKLVAIYYYNNRLG